MLSLKIPRMVSDFYHSLMRDYFASLGESAHPDSSDPRARAITRFQELLLVSFREFSVITDETILTERRRFRSEIIHSIESFSKRSAVRNLKSLGRFTKEQAGLIYDALYKAMCIVPPPPAAVPEKALFTTGDGNEAKPETRIGLHTFQHFLSEIATWARDEKIVMNGFQVGLFFLSLTNRLMMRFLCSNASTEKLQSTSSLTDYSFSGTRHVRGHCHSRYEVFELSLFTFNLRVGVRISSLVWTE